MNKSNLILAGSGYLGESIISEYNIIKNTFIEITDYSTFFKDYKKNRKELEDLKSINISSEIIQFENKELKELLIYSYLFLTSDFSIPLPIDFY